MRNIKIGILDQVLITDGSNSESIIKGTIDSAIVADKLGYNRFWIAEHHNHPMFACSSPELLVSYILGKTRNILVGTGGVMLNNYSSYKVAENFKLIASFASKRLEIGIGSAPGGDQLASEALKGDGFYIKDNTYEEKVNNLLYLLKDSVPLSHNWHNLLAYPRIETIPTLWILGSSESSAILAAKKKLPYCFALFINNANSFDIVKKYIKHFESSEDHKPKVILAIYVICGETQEHSEWLASTLDYCNLMLYKGKNINHLPSPETLKEIKYTEVDKEIIKRNRKGMIIGDIKIIAEELMDLCLKYDTDEIIINAITHDLNERQQIYRRIAKRFLSAT